jgi:hypothetical protein
MKYIILFILLIPLVGLSQDSTITNLQLRARTIKVLAAFANQSGDTSMVKAFLAWNVEFKTNNPADNANVTIATAKTVDVAKMYGYLLALPAGYHVVEDFVGDFKTSIQSKRNTNPLLDGLCTTLESQMTAAFTALKTAGSQFVNVK